METCDLIILGGGSAGFGAAYQALLHGNFRVILVEQNPGLGGLSTFGGVNCWEPGISGTGVHQILAHRLQESGNGFVGRFYNEVTPETPWGHSKRCDDPYETTLRRGYILDPDLRRFHFEPAAMDKTMQELLAEVSGDRLELLLNSHFESLTCENGHITTLQIQSRGHTRTFVPKLVLDCSSDICIASACGCQTLIGDESKALFNEPSASSSPCGELNGITQVFRVTPASPGYIQDVPKAYADVDLTDWYAYMDSTNGPIACFNDYPNGDININMLPTIEGTALLSMPLAQLKHLCEARAYAYWNWVATRHGFTGYRVKTMFPMLGIRESRRLLGRYTLREQDLDAGIPAPGKERIIAWADHPADRHRGGGNASVLCRFDKYGIPYDCLLPPSPDNLIVACRGASFSHIAGSSARLSRTMMALGEAAGLAACQCVEQNISPAAVDVSLIRKMMNVE